MLLEIFNTFVEKSTTMNLNQKLTSMLLAAAVCLTVSCKKSADTAKTDNTAAIGKQLALDFYNSLSGGVSTFANKGIKPGSTGRIITMSAPSCGQAVTTTTNRTETHGDTTRTYLGNSIFTYMCNGFLNDGVDLDAYTDVDTLTITDASPSFKNINTVTLNYDVRALDSTYHHLKVNGQSGTSLYTSKLSGNTTTSSYSTVTNYTWNDIMADTSGPKNVFIGTIDYSTQMIDISASTGPDGITYNYHGTLQLLPNFKIMVTFKYTDGTTKVYLVDLIAGTSTLQS